METSEHMAYGQPEIVKGRHDQLCKTIERVLAQRKQDENDQCNISAQKDQVLHGKNLNRHPFQEALIGRRASPYHPPHKTQLNQEEK